MCYTYHSKALQRSLKILLDVSCQLICMVCYWLPLKFHIADLQIPNES